MGKCVVCAQLYNERVQKYIKRVDIPSFSSLCNLRLFVCATLNDPPELMIYQHIFNIDVLSARYLLCFTLMLSRTNPLTIWIDFTRWWCSLVTEILCAHDTIIRYEQEKLFASWVYEFSLWQPTHAAPRTLIEYRIFENKMWASKIFRNFLFLAKAALLNSLDYIFVEQW